jgi:hypothetical protein
MRGFLLHKTRHSREQSLGRTSSARSKGSFEFIGDYADAEENVPALMARLSNCWTSAAVKLFRGRSCLKTLRRKFVSFDEIAEDALAYSKVHKRSWRDDESRIKPLVEWWANQDAERITTFEIERQLSDTSRIEKWLPQRSTTIDLF